MAEKLTTRQKHCLQKIASTLRRTGPVIISAPELRKQYRLTEDQVVHLIAAVGLCFAYIAKHEEGVPQENIWMLRNIIKPKP